MWFWLVLLLHIPFMSEPSLRSGDTQVTWVPGYQTVIVVNSKFDWFGIFILDSKLELLVLFCSKRTTRFTMKFLFNSFNFITQHLTYFPVCFVQIRSRNNSHI